MDFDLNNVRAALYEDRLSALPHELILQILSRVDTKLAIQTCLLLFPRWKLIWTLMPRLNFSDIRIKSLDKFKKFVTHVLSHRNHQAEVSSVNLCLLGEESQVLFREIANYAFSHNVQQLIVYTRTKNEFPPYLFKSQTLNHLTFRTCVYDPCLTPKTPWDFPALTTLYLDDISLCDDERESLDLFSKCVNLQNLTLEKVRVKAKVFEIITPRLANLRLVYNGGFNVINVIAHQLENLTIIECSTINDLIIPSGLASFCYKGYHPPHWFKNWYFSVNKVTICLCIYGKRPEDARSVIKMLQELHSVRFLTLNLDIVKSISSFPELISGQPSPFRKLIRLDIDCDSWDTWKLKMSPEARNFFLENSPNATIFMHLNN